MEKSVNYKESQYGLSSRDPEQNNLDTKAGVLNEDRRRLLRVAISSALAPVLLNGEAEAKERKSEKGETEKPKAGQKEKEVIPPWIKKVEKALEGRVFKAVRVTRLAAKEKRLYPEQALRKGEVGESLSIASITKILTALTAYTYCDENKIDTTTRKAKVKEVDLDNASKSKDKRIKVGQEYSVDELVGLCLIKSTNAAAEVLARHLGGRDAFIKKMNEVAKQSGLAKFSFDSPSGLSAGCKATVDGVETLVLAAYNSKYPIGQITREMSTENSEGDGMGSANRIFMNIVKSRGLKIHIQKTGFIKESGKCLVFIVEKVSEKKFYCVTVLGSPAGGKNIAPDMYRRETALKIIDALY